MIDRIEQIIADAIADSYDQSVHDQARAVIAALRAYGYRIVSK